MKRTIILFFLITFSQGGVAMGIFDAGNTCVFSQVKARITWNGEPLTNTTVIRRWEWKELREDSTTSDDNGRFEFPAVFERSLTRMLPLELVIAQGLYVVVDGEEQKIWSNSKRNPIENGEFKGSPINLTCELTDELEIHRDFGSIMNTLCKWSN